MNLLSISLFRLVGNEGEASTKSVERLLWYDACLPTMMHASRQVPARRRENMLPCFQELI